LVARESEPARTGDGTHRAIDDADSAPEAAALSKRPGRVAGMNSQLLTRVSLLGFMRRTPLPLPGPEPNLAIRVAALLSVSARHLPWSQPGEQIQGRTECRRVLAINATPPEI
jgi:hypothetical protein